jgi:hypothetical protein
MSSFKVYDKVKWHYPEGKGCPDIESAKQHFSAVMKWLNKNNLLSEEGDELFELGVDSDFSITSSMLSEKGNKILQKKYSKLLKNIDYSKKPTKEYIDKYLS